MQRSSASSCGDEAIPLLKARLSRGMTSLTEEEDSNTFAKIKQKGLVVLIYNVLYIYCMRRFLHGKDVG